MLLALFVLLILIPIVELIVIVQMAHAIGVFPALLVLVLVSFVGAWLVKREGLGVIRRTREQITRGEIPTGPLVDGLLVVIAGAMLLFPGFVTDAIGLLLLVPPVRALVRRLLIGRFRTRIDRSGSGRVYDVRTVRYVQSTYDPTDGTSNPPRSPRELERG